MNEEEKDTTTTTKLLATRVGKVLSHSSTRGGFSTALVYEPDDASEKQHGSLYFVIDIGSPSPLSADIAYNIIDIVKEEYYSDLELSAGESFENALKAANSELAAIAKEGEKDWMGKLNIIVAAVKDKDMYIVQRGTAEIHLLRDNNMINLSKGMYTPGETYRPEETLVNLIEGELGVGDRMLASTSELFYFISVEKLKRLIGDNTPAQATKKLATMLEQEDEINRTSVLLAEFNTPELFAQEEETEPTENWVGEPREEKVVQPKARGLMGLSRAKTVADAIRSVPKEESVDQDEPAVDEEPAPPLTPQDDLVIDEAKESKPKIKRPSFSDLKASVNVRDYQSAVGLNSGQLKKFGEIALKTLKVVGLLLLTLVDATVTVITNTVRNIRKRPGGDRVLMGIVAVLVVAVVVSTLALAQGYSGRVSTRNATAALAEAQQKRDAAQASLIYEDAVRARELLAEAYTLAESATHNTRTQEAAAVLVANLQKQLDEVSNVSRFTGVSPLVDFDVLSAQLTASTDGERHVQIGNIIVLGGNIYTADPENNKVYKYKGASAEVAIINSLVSTDKKLTLSTPASDSELIFMTTPPNIYSLSLVNNSLANRPLDEGSWNNAAGLIAYGDKLYLLDPANNQIWKYKVVPEGYSQIASYFEIGSTPEISTAIDFAIDGSIFVLLPDNVIKKYLGGEEVEFSLYNIPAPYPAISRITNIYADIVAEKLYVLDAPNRRVLAFDKEGVYLAQYIYDNIDEPQDLFVDEAGGFIYLTSGTNVYRLPLR